VSIVNMSFGTYGCGDQNGQLGELVLPKGVTVNDTAALEITIRNLRDLVGVELVAAAGNDASELPFYPAAFEDVIGVGAIDVTRPNTPNCVDNTSGNYVWSAPDADGDCALLSGLTGDSSAGAEFSNFGDQNVMVSAPGVDVVVDYPTDSGIVFPYMGGSTAVLSGKVRVSGTSLAAPFYAACQVAPNSGPCALAP
ncbi:MAG: S8 family serine peptidase, partial [Acidimicrobiales bacterium]